MNDFEGGNYQNPNNDLVNNQNYYAPFNNDNSVASINHAGNLNSLILIRRYAVCQLFLIAYLGVAIWSITALPEMGWALFGSCFLFSAGISIFLIFKTRRFKDLFDKRIFICLIVGIFIPIVAWVIDGILIYKTIIFIKTNYGSVKPFI
ncbi:MAG: hypothetical protein HUJ42_01985 [Malacoplasma sp.]|nr:hypothetical protein [Malacoplasma sp.]